MNRPKRTWLFVLLCGLAAAGLAAGAYGLVHVSRSLEPGASAAGATQS